MGFFIGDNMSKNVQTGDVIFSEDGETLLREFPAVSYSRRQEAR